MIRSSLLNAILENRYQENLLEGRVGPGKSEYLRRAFLNFIKNFGQEEGPKKFIATHGQQAYDDFIATGMIPKPAAPKPAAAPPPTPVVPNAQAQTEVLRNERIEDLLAKIRERGIGTQENPIVKAPVKEPAKNPLATATTERTAVEVIPNEITTQEKGLAVQSKSLVKKDPIPKTPPPANPPPPRLPPPQRPLLPSPPPRVPVEVVKADPFEPSIPELSSAYVPGEVGRVYTGPLGLAGDVRGMSQLAQRWKIA